MDFGNPKELQFFNDVLFRVLLEEEEGGCDSEAKVCNKKYDSVSFAIRIIFELV